MNRIVHLVALAAAALLLISLSCSTGPGTNNSITTDPTLNIGIPMQVLKGDVATFNVALSTTNSVDVTFHYETADGTAQATRDYVSTSGNATIPHGTLKTSITVQTVATALGVDHKTFRLVISSPKNAKLGVNSSRFCTIYENPELVVHDTSAVSGDTATVVVSLNISMDSTVIFHYATADSSAIAGTDYESVSGIDSITTTNRRAIIYVPTKEPIASTKAFKVSISNAVRAAIVRSTAACSVATIPTLSINNAAPVPAGDTALFTVSLSKSRALPVIFQHATADSVAHSDWDYLAMTGSDTIPPGATGTIIKVPTKLSAQAGSNIVFKLTLSSPVHATLGNSSSVCRIAPLPLLSVSDTAIVQGALALFVVSLNESPLAAVTFTYSTSDSTAVAGTDYTPPSDSTGQILLGQTSVIIPVLTRLDAPYAPGKYFKFTISSPAHARIDRATAACRIDQANPTASFVGDVFPILQSAACARNGCHGGGASSGGLNLGTMTRADLLSANGTHGSFLMPNSSELSRFYRILTTRLMTPNTIRMPKDAAPLSISAQNKIRDWIDQGAKDN